MSNENNAVAEGKVVITARVFRCAWEQRPNWVPVSAWLWMAKRRVFFTGRWENLGELASSDKGTASAQLA